MNEINTTDQVLITVKEDENGHQISSFTINPNYIDPNKKQDEKEEEHLGFWGTICSWFKRHEVKPYVTKRNLNEPTFEGESIRPKSAWEIGIKGTF